MDKNNIKTNINYLNRVQDLPQEIHTELSNKSNLSIELDGNSNNPINKFLLLNKSKVYLEPNHKINIDLEQENFELFLFLIDCIDEAYLKITNASSKYKNIFNNANRWNISVCDNIFFNYPFTLDEYIYLPIQYIKFCYEQSMPNNLIETMIHEKIHTNQRINEIEWEQYIREQDSNWIKLVPQINELYQLVQENIFINPDKLIDTTEYEFISNPDTTYDNFKYVYRDENKKMLLYGHYVYNKKTKKINKEFFLIDASKRTMIKTSDILEQEHPYETYAYKISTELMKNM